MRNSIIIGLCLAFAALGFTGGSYAQAARDAAEIEAAWDDITVVADGTLVPNPSAYAYDPEKLASSRNVRIISNRQAAIDISNEAVIETAFNR